MANTTPLLTDTQIKRAKPCSKEYSLSDPRGLHLRVMPSGIKKWLFNYQKPLTKKRTNMKLGIYPELSLVDARHLRDHYRSLLANGKDPQTERKQQHNKDLEEQTNTLKSVALNWFENHSSDLSHKYSNDIMSSLQNHVFPALGDKPLKELKAPETIRVLKPLADQNKLEMVKRICQRLNMIMSYAVNTGIVDTNPLAGIGVAFKAPKKRSHPTISPNELPQLMEAIDNASILFTTKCLIEWQMHTMVRPSEAALTKWSEIDSDSGIWSLPAERMKTGRNHKVLLSNQALELLRDIEPISGQRTYVFPSNRNPRSHASSASVNMAFRRMGFKGRLVGHGLRALASTVLNEEGFDKDLIEAALSHVDKNTVRSAYNRAEYLDRRRSMMQWWSDYIDKAKSF